MYQLQQMNNEFFDDLKILFDAQTTFIAKTVEDVLQKSTPAPTSITNPRIPSSPAHESGRRRRRGSPTTTNMDHSAATIPPVTINFSSSGARMMTPPIPYLEASSAMTESITELSSLDTSQEDTESMNDASYEAVEPVSPLVNIHGKGASSVSGYIEGANITVNFDPQLETNIISEVEAVRLNLDIDYLKEVDKNSAQRFRFEDGSIESIIGWVKFTWSKYPHKHHGRFTVHCAVYARNDPKLVLGKPFAQKRRRYERD